MCTLVRKEGYGLNVFKRPDAGKDACKRDQDILLRKVGREIEGLCKVKKKRCCQTEKELDSKARV